MTIIIPLSLFIFTFLSAGIAVAIYISSKSSQGWCVSFSIFYAAAGS